MSIKDSGYVILKKEEDQKKSGVRVSCDNGQLGT